jgi:hypothetical protein
MNIHTQIAYREIFAMSDLSSRNKKLQILELEKINKPKEAA